MGERLLAPRMPRSCRSCGRRRPTSACASGSTSTARTAWPAVRCSPTTTARSPCASKRFMAVGETASLREATVTVLTVVGGGAGTPCDAAPCVRVWRSSGRYHETYYLWLRLHHDSDRFVLARYTVPPVVTPRLYNPPWARVAACTGIRPRLCRLAYYNETEGASEKNSINRSARLKRSEGVRRRTETSNGVARRTCGRSGTPTNGCKQGSASHPPCARVRGFWVRLAAQQQNAHCPRGTHRPRA